jgi:hypothetical protein
VQTKRIRGFLAIRFAFLLGCLQITSNTSIIDFRGFGAWPQPTKGTTEWGRERTPGERMATPDRRKASAGTAGKRDVKMKL